MPKDKSETHIKIMEAAKQEFLENGYEQASMRTIAAKVGMSAAGLYRHFSDKEAMFDALLHPLFQRFQLEFEKYKRIDYELLEKNQLDKMWEEHSDLNLLISLMYSYYDEFKLLLCHAQGTRHENFIHEFVIMEEKETLIYLEEAKKKGVPVKSIVPKELHLLLSAYYSAIFEVIIHDFTKDEAVHYLDTLQRFFYPGWRSVLGL